MTRTTPPVRGTLLAFALAVWMVAVAQGANVATTAGNGKHFLWRVTNAAQPFYLLGSVHRLPSSDSRIPDVMQSAARQSQQMLFEIDPREGSALGGYLRASSRYPTGHTIREKVHPETYVYLQKLFQKSHVNFNQYNTLKPWAIALTMFRVPGMQNVTNSRGVDRQMFQIANAEHKQTSGLESAAAHAAVFTTMTDEESEVLLLRSIIYADKASGDFANMLAAWKTGDTRRIWDIDAPTRIEAPSIHARLLENRNANWIPRIESAIKSGKPTMVVAGAAHFCGPQSVIALLQARGYKVEQL